MLKVLSLCCFYFTMADLLSGCYVVSSFTFLCVCTKETLVKAERFELKGFGPPCGT